MNEFQQFHNEMRKLTNPRMFYPTFLTNEQGKYIGKQPPYARSKNPNEIKGKKNIRYAKRLKVRIWKEQNEGSNKNQT